MPVFTCPKGHQSSEPDFCSECGAKMQRSPGEMLSAPTPARAASGSSSCPDCGAPRADSLSNFCEICGYNFSTGTHGNVPLDMAAAAGPVPAPPESDAGASAEPAPAVTEAAPAVTEPGAAASEPALKQWSLVAVIDPALRDVNGPEPPANVDPLTVRLEKPVNLIGRRSERRAILPEISLDLDDGISHRHALLTCAGDGSLKLRDVGSANGTRLNGSDIEPLVDVPLHDGDEITVGRWTRLTVRAE
jgi:FHA domain